MHLVSSRLYLGSILCRATACTPKFVTLPSTRAFSNLNDVDLFYSHQHYLIQYLTGLLHLPRLLLKLLLLCKRKHLQDTKLPLKVLYIQLASIRFFIT